MKIEGRKVVKVEAYRLSDGKYMDTFEDAVIAETLKAIKWPYPLGCNCFDANDPKSDFHHQLIAALCICVGITKDSLGEKQ